MIALYLFGNIRVCCIVGILLFAGCCVFSFHTHAAYTCVQGELVEPIRSALVCYTDMQLSADDRELKDDNVSTKTV